MALKQVAILTVLTIACAAGAQQSPPGPLNLKDGPMGAVKFDHQAHLKVAAKCEVCHHASKPEKPMKASQQACTECHTNPATPPAGTNLEAAFHNRTATAGLCIDCHEKQNANGKAAPVKCADCHQKAAA